MDSTSSQKSSSINVDQLKPVVSALLNDAKDSHEKSLSDRESEKYRPEMKQRDSSEKKSVSYESLPDQASWNKTVEIQHSEPFVKSTRGPKNPQSAANFLKIVDFVFEKIRIGNADCLFDIPRLMSELLINNFIFDLDMQHPLTNQTLLTTAILSNHTEMVEGLLAQGCSAKVPNGRGETPLEVAVISGDYLNVRALLTSKEGSSLLIFPSDKLSILVCRAAELGHSAIIEEFISWVRRNPSVSTPHAVKNNKSADQLRIAGKLRQQEEAYDYFFHGKPKMPTGQRAMSAALSRVEGKQVLGEKDRAYLGLDKALGHAALAGRSHAVQVLAAQGAEINAFCLYDATALSLAAGAGHAHIVNLLIKIGADVNHINTLSPWPLLAAVKGEHEEVVRLLINHGADKRRGTYFGLILRQAAQKTGNRRILDLLR